MAKAASFRSNIPHVRTQLHEGLADGSTAAAGRLLDASRPKVPTDTGALRDSGEVTTDRDELTAAVAYGTDAATAGYATVVHERMDLAHDNGQAKFVEAGIAETRGELAEVMAAETRKRTRS